MQRSRDYRPSAVQYSTQASSNRGQGPSLGCPKAKVKGARTCLPSIESTRWDPGREGSAVGGQSGLKMIDADVGAAAARD